MPRRRTNIYKRKDGRWEARYAVGKNDAGKTIYASVYGSSYREAKEKQLLSIQRLPSILPTSKTSITLEEWMKYWLSSISNSVKCSTLLKYECLARNHVVPILGKVQLKGLTSQMIDRLADKKLHQNKPLSPKTVNDILSVISLALDLAEEEYGMTKPRICRVKETRKEMRVLTKQEQKILESFLLQDIDSCKLGVIIALYSGLRIGELCALNWEDIKDGNIIVNKSLHRIKTGSKTIVELTTPKTENSIRIIPIPSSIHKLVENYRSVGPVCQTASGKYVEPRLMQQKFAKYILACGIDAASFHALRHTFATRCVEAGFDIKTLSEILGHTDVKTTLNRYVHSSYELKQSNMEKLQISV